MRDAIFSTIIMAAISSLAFIAYKHPKGYARMYVPLMFIAFVSLVVWWAYSIGYFTGFSDSSVGYLKLNQTAILKSPEREQSPFWVWVLPSAFMFYLIVLKLLPLILDLPSEDKKEDKPKDKVNAKDSDA